MTGLTAIKKSGECFGYDELMHKNHRTSTTIAIKDTDLFILEEKHFDKSFSKSILKNDIDRREFLMDKVPCFKIREKYFYSKFKFFTTHVK